MKLNNYNHYELYIGNRVKKHYISWAIALNTVNEKFQYIHIFALRGLRLDMQHDQLCPPSKTPAVFSCPGYHFVSFVLGNVA